MGFSTLGNRPNELEAFGAVGKSDDFTVVSSGNGRGAVHNEASYCLIAPCKVAAAIPEAHILMGHLLCGQVEAAVVDSPSEFEVSFQS